MRKIEEQMCEALTNRRYWTNSNTNVAVNHLGEIDIYLHGNHIAHITPDGTVSLSSADTLFREHDMSTLTHEGQAIQTVREDWQTQARGTNSNEYDIYVSCMKGTGEYIKTYEEWLNS